MIDIMQKDGNTIVTIRPTKQVETELIHLIEKVKREAERGVENYEQISFFAKEGKTNESI